MNDTEELWIPLAGWEGYYEVSTMGRARSIIRFGVLSTGGRRGYGGGIIAPVLKVSTGYFAFNLTRRGKRKQMSAHRAVLLSFVGPPPDGHQGCHNNGIRTDNRLCNLRWDTVKNNHADKVLHGTRFASRDKRRLKRYARGCEWLLQAKSAG